MKTQRSGGSRHSIVILAIGCVLGWMTAGLNPAPRLNADEDRREAPAAFKSGGERSAEILAQISKQITKLDERLARIETAVAGSAAKKN